MAFQDPSLETQKLLALDPQAQALSRQQQTADLLLQNSTQQPTGQLISGRYVAPSWAQQLNPLFNAVAGSYLNYNADQKLQNMADEAMKLAINQDLSEVAKKLEELRLQNGGKPNLTVVKNLDKVD